MFYQVISISVPCEIALVGFRQLSSRNTYLHIIQRIHTSSKFNNFIINLIDKFARILLHRNINSSTVSKTQPGDAQPCSVIIIHHGSHSSKHSVIDASVALNKWLLEMRYIIHEYRPTTSRLVGCVYRPFDSKVI